MPGSGGAALVTGGGRRLGAAMGMALARRGLDVVVHYRHSAAEAEAVATACRALGVQATTIQADLLDRTATAALVPAAAAALGRPLTVLINNAARFAPDTLATATAADWDPHMGANLFAPFVLMQAFAAQAPRALPDASGELRAQACVINLIDAQVSSPEQGFVTYTLSKRGLWDLTRLAARALAPHIRVNAIGPGATLRAARQSPAHFAAQRAAAPLGRGASPEEICRTLQFLLDSPSITGQMVCVDGGQHLL